MIADCLVRPKDVVPTVASLQEHFECIRLGEIERVRGRLGRLSPDAESAIESLTRGIIHKVLLPTIMALESGSAEGDFTYFAELVHRIFNLGGKRNCSRCSQEARWTASTPSQPSA